MDSTVPTGLLKLKDRLEAWRATRKYARQPIPGEFRQAAADMDSIDIVTEPNGSPTLFCTYA